MAMRRHRQSNSKNELQQQQQNQQQQQQQYGTIALLNLPPQTSLSLNASAAQILRKEEPLIVIREVTPSNGFHLLVVRAGNTGSGGGGMDGGSGFILHSSAILFLFNEEENGCGGVGVGGEERKDWFVARKYDVQTEEISPEAALDDRSCDNLEKSILNYTKGNNSSTSNSTSGTDGCSSGSLNPTRIITYDAFTTATTTTTNDTIDCNNDTPSMRQQRQSDWFLHLTKFISHTVLERHGLSGRGDKIIPGTYYEEEDDITEHMTKTTTAKINVVGTSDTTTTTAPPTTASNPNPEDESDGVTLSYPPIPCIDLQQRCHLHGGTRRFLAGLSPSDRTDLFIRHNGTATDGWESSSSSSSPEDVVFRRVLKDCYGGRWDVLFGEWQLSFVLFVCLGCLSSLEHWRDTLTMLSLVHTSTVESYPQLYDNLLNCLNCQMSHFESGLLLDDLDYSRDNFLLPALKQLCSTCSKIQDGDQYHIGRKASEVLRRVFPNASGGNSNSSNSINDFEIIQDDNEQSSSFGGGDCNVIDINKITSDDDDDDDNDDEDGPVIIPFDEIQASMDRSSLSPPPPSPMDTTTTSQRDTVQSERKAHGDKYPLLFAAMTIVEEHEDVLMACARILDERLDVSLVREAAAYLEEVEAQR